MINKSTPNEFTDNRDAILLTAAHVYHAQKDNLPLDPTMSQVNVMPQNLGDMSPAQLQEAKAAQAKVSVAARALGRVAYLADEADKGGLRSLVPRVELALTRIFDRDYIGSELRPGGLVDAIRGVKRSDQ